MDEWRRSGQIPTFGNWDHANELPITQYFECARQAGLVRNSNSSGECDLYVRGDLYSYDLNKPSRNSAHPRKTRLREKRGPHVKEQKRQGKVCDVTDPPRKLHQQQQQKHHHQQPISVYNVTYTTTTTTDGGGNKKDTLSSLQRPKLPVARPPKAVDEDLYKIPPELLRSSKRNKRPGFFSCLVPACAS
ncbi:hypothetical protein Tsubulata_000814 [Turnera subulata]|uniref:RIN4 pathogenic type III effector avirulence factor Avr cleavage site domain-containing protein n=1 Tax=Turnera subulata TaxID=218843 RepID=A0A9Q0JMI6_9ROSI|nr:hypothetical protein Tsubulata_000814 [Turnera subulata]